MKSVKCAIGATILTPILLVTIGGGMLWLLTICPTVLFIVCSLLISISLIGVWTSIYDFCTEHNNSKKEI